MTKLKKVGMGLMSLAIIGAAGLANFAHAAAIDYASTTAAIDDATSGLGSTLLSGSLKVIGIALGVWGLFFLVRKLRQIVK